jgi:hypothetical protein
MAIANYVATMAVTTKRRERNMKTITTNLRNVHALTGLSYGDDPKPMRIKRALIGMPEDAKPTDIINEHGATWQDLANHCSRSM